MSWRNKTIKWIQRIAYYLVYALTPLGRWTPTFWFESSRRDRQWPRFIDPKTKWNKSCLK